MARSALMNRYSLERQHRARRRCRSRRAATRTSGVGSSPGSTRVAQAHPHAGRADAGCGQLGLPPRRAGPSAGGRAGSAFPSRVAAKLLRSTSSSAKRTECPPRARGAAGLACRARTSGALGRRQVVGHPLRRAARSPRQIELSARRAARPRAPARAGRGARCGCVSSSGASGIGRRKEKQRRANGSSRAGLHALERAPRSASPAPRRAAPAGPTARARARSA